MGLGVCKSELRGGWERSLVVAGGIHVHPPTPTPSQLRRSTCAPMAGSIFNLNLHCF